MKSTYKQIPMVARYLINTALIVAFLAVGTTVISSGLINRAQSSVVLQVGIYIILAVSLNIVTGYLGQLPLGHAGFMAVGAYAGAIFWKSNLGGSLPTGVAIFIGLVLAGIVAAIFGILIGILAALIMNKTAFRGKPVPFVMELPNYRMPGLKSVALLLWEKAKDFLQRAFTVIFLATIIIWFLQSFDTRLNVVADSANSLLALIGQFIAPVFRPLGFGDWRCATALISGFIAKESVVSTLQVLLGGAAISSLLTTRSAISFLVFTLLYTPCVAAIATIRRELDSRLKTVGVVVLQCSVAWVVALAAYAIAGLV